MPTFCDAENVVEDQFPEIEPVFQPAKVYPVLDGAAERVMFVVNV